MLKQSLIAAGTVGWIVVAAIAGGIDRTNAKAQQETQKGPEMTAAAQTGYAPVNGLQVYYEIHGTGRPLVLLHGGFGTNEWPGGDLMRELAKDHEVVAVELQAHGHTADIDRPMTYEAMADDVAGVIRYLDLKDADVMGYSLGGGVALRTAIQHPDLVRRLVLVSTPFKRQGWLPEVLEGMAQVSAASAPFMTDTPMYKAYVEVAPRPQDFPVLAEKLGTLLKTEYDWTAEVSAMKTPTLLIAGDADSVRVADQVAFFGLLGGGKKDGASLGRPESQLAIVPNTTHFTIDTPAIAPMAETFLNAPSLQ